MFPPFSALTKNNFYAFCQHRLEAAEILDATVRFCFALSGFVVTVTQQSVHERKRMEKDQPLDIGDPHPKADIFIPTPQEVAATQHIEKSSSETLPTDPQNSENTEKNSATQNESQSSTNPTNETNASISKEETQQQILESLPKLPNIQEASDSESSDLEDEQNLKQAMLDSDEDTTHSAPRSRHEVAVRDFCFSLFRASLLQKRSN
jgi:hypothetical protein